MFTGLVQDRARLESTEARAGGRRLWVMTRAPQAQRLNLGDSVALNGACMTVVERRGEALAFDVSPESLACTNLGLLEAGDELNLECALRLGDPLGGHWVTGHVDATAELLAKEKQADYLALRVLLKGEARAKIAPFLVPKGSIAVNGVSLTVNRVGDEGGLTHFELLLIPHTLSATTFGDLPAGARVNLEADIMAKHWVRYQEFSRKV